MQVGFPLSQAFVQQGAIVGSVGYGLWPTTARGKQSRSTSAGARIRSLPPMPIIARHSAAPDLPPRGFSPSDIQSLHHDRDAQQGVAQAYQDGQPPHSTREQLKCRTCVAQGCNPWHDFRVCVYTIWRYSSAIWQGIVREIVLAHRRSLRNGCGNDMAYTCAV